MPRRRRGPGARGAPRLSTCPASHENLDRLDPEVPMPKLKQRPAAPGPRTRAWHLEPTAAETASRYDRARDLPRLVPMWPRELADAEASLIGHLALIAKITRALRRERQSGLAGDWAYDAGRHRGLLAALQRERALCRRRWGLTLSGRTATAAAGLTRPFRAACRGPSASPTPSAPPRSSAPPSDSREAGPISPDTPRATGCSGSSDAASAT